MSNHFCMYPLVGFLKLLIRMPSVKILCKARTFFSAHNTHIFLRVENQFHYISITYYLFAGKLVGSYQLLKYFSWKVTRQDFPDYYFQLSKQKKH